MGDTVHKLCLSCKHKCKQLEMVDIMSCKYLLESAEARRQNTQYTKEYETKNKHV
jgi:hypothetical protein